MKPTTRAKAFAIAILAALCLQLPQVTRGGDEVTHLRIGVYDSRAIAVAYKASDHNDPVMVKKSAQKKKAEQAGNTKTVAEIEAWMQHETKGGD